jgi:hypothetical protein
VGTTIGDPNVALGDDLGQGFAVDAFHSGEEGPEESVGQPAPDMAIHEVGQPAARPGLQSLGDPVGFDPQPDPPGLPG